MKTTHLIHIFNLALVCLVLFRLICDPFTSDALARQNDEMLRTYFDVQQALDMVIYEIKLRRKNGLAATAGQGQGLGRALPQGQGLELPMGNSNLKTSGDINNNNSNTINNNNIAINNTSTTTASTEEEDIWRGGAPADMATQSWPWWTPDRFIYMKKYPDLFFPQRIYRLTFFQQIFVFFEHPKSSKLGTLCFAILLCVIMIGVTSSILQTSVAYHYTPTTCAEPACNNDPNLCPGTIQIQTHLNLPFLTLSSLFEPYLPHG